MSEGVDAEEAGPARDSAEHRRLGEADRGERAWRRWGAYLSERQWGTVREDYSATGDAWDAFPHDHARSRAYRWGEDGIAGFSDDRQLLCLSLALWNGQDPILKERLFGLTNGQGNHGEDVKEVYVHADATPTHSYARYLYRYPQRAFPYADLLAENARRGRDVPEYELADTGVLAGDRFFDVTIEYAKQEADDLLMRIGVINRGPEAAPLHVLPQAWFRNVWSWRPDPPARPELAASADEPGVMGARHPWLGPIRIEAMPGPGGVPELIFCDNDTNAVRLFGPGAGDGREGPFKDGFHDAIVEGRPEALRGRRFGTKAGAHHRLTVPAGGEMAIRLRLSMGPRGSGPPAASRLDDEAFDAVVTTRRQEADAFYAIVQAAVPDPAARRVQRQAFAGMIWSQQLYRLDVRRWLEGDAPSQPSPPPERAGPTGRDTQWHHLNNADVLSMPDTWEYPWYAAWDLAFQCLPLALVDPTFAKGQLVLLTREWYMHPNGQLPAYEWNFGDVNPPVHAWAAWRVFEIDRGQVGGAGDVAFLERIFHKLLINFTWWVNRKDARGLNVFQGGFLGMDNVGVFDRNTPVPGGGTVNQADGTAWMAMFSLNMMRIGLELALHNPVYEDIATKFFEHFLLIAEAMTDMGQEGHGLWDDQDSFYYDTLEFPSGAMMPLRVRSAVGLIPLFAVEVLEPDLLARLPNFALRMRWVLKNRPELAALVSHWSVGGTEDRRLLSLLRGHRMKRLLARMLDETEFLSPHGVRSLSKYHADHPYSLDNGADAPLTIAYRPGDSDSGLFGGNSNWRGPVWFPINHLIVESLRRFHAYYGDEFQVECPTGSGRFVTVEGVADELSRRLTSLFVRDPRTGLRPATDGDGPGPGAARPEPDRFGHDTDPVLFNEYFHGDTGRGLGASHQTGWTGLIANLIQDRAASSRRPMSTGEAG